MNILGIGGSDHSFSACLISDNKLVCAIEEERISREKYGLGMESMKGKSRQYCLDKLGIPLEDIDIIIGNDLLFPMYYHNIRKRIKFINHHLSHAYSGFYTLQVDKCAILVIDGTGSRYGKLAETITYGESYYGNFRLIDKVFGIGWKKENNKETLTTNSIGDFYRRFTEGIGFKYLQDGKTMGLAPYGTDKYYNRIKKFVKFLGDGRLEINVNNNEIDHFFHETFNGLNEEERFQVQADIAWGAQAVTEDCVLYCVDYLYEKTKLKDLCIVGGVALNSVANGKVKKYSKFKNIYIPPYSSDSGTAIGAAFYGHSLVSKDKIMIGVSDYEVFTGKCYDEKTIKSVLESNHDIAFSYCEDICKTAAQKISEGKIIGWFQENSEIGPRALGHRSILADPRRPEMKDRINYDIKHREGFRPFAPSILNECASEYFDIDFQSPYMLFVVDVKEHKKSIIPAVVHVDDTARVQTVTFSENPLYYNLINEFYKITNVPIVLNTSFNVINGEPIVETPEDAIKSFIHSNLDLLIIGNWIVYKNIK